MQPSPLSNARWHMPKRIGMLFLTIYLFFLFMDFTSSDEIFPAFVYKLLKPYTGFWDWLVPWTGKHLLHLGYPITVKPNGSGDTTYNYVMQLLWIVIALIIGAVWAWADRKRPGYNQLYYWVRVFTRYYFAYVLFSYGFVKVIQLQFPFPGLVRLTETYGDSSPMGLAWTFIGYSKGYNIFAGGAEVLAGCLLFFKRTTLLGALMAMTVMINVAAMNFAYDIPVKLFSCNLVFLSVFLAAHDFGRIKSFFFLNKVAPPAHLGMPARTRRRLLIQRALKALFIGFALYSTLWSSIKAIDEWGEGEPRSPLYGIYKIESFRRGGVMLPPLTTDSVRWKQIIFGGPDYARITTMTDSSRWMNVKIDTVRKSLWFISEKARPDSFLLHYSQPDKEHLLLSGNMGSDSVQMGAKWLDHTKFRLVSRGFHWVNEYPYNR